MLIIALLLLALMMMVATMMMIMTTTHRLEANPNMPGIGAEGAVLGERICKALAGVSHGW